MKRLLTVLALVSGVATAEAPKDVTHVYFASTQVLGSPVVRQGQDLLGRPFTDSTIRVRALLSGCLDSVAAYASHYEYVGPRRSEVNLYISVPAYATKGSQVANCRVMPFKDISVSVPGYVSKVRIVNLGGKSFIAQPVSADLDQESEISVAE